MNKVALIIGAGPGISAAFAKELLADGYTVALASRDIERLSHWPQALVHMLLRWMLIQLKIFKNYSML